MITWEIGRLPSQSKGQIRYKATLGSSFSERTTTITNKVTITSKEVEDVTATSPIKVEVEPTPTPSSSQVEDTSRSTGIFTEKEETRWLFILLGGLTIGVLVALVYVGTHEPKSLDNISNTLDDAKIAEKRIDLAQQRLSVVREGIFLVFIISAILILAIGEGIREDGAISILSAIVGYIFGRAVSR